MNEISSVLGLFPVLLALLLCFRAGTRRARGEKWLRPVLLSFFLLLLGWFMCYTSGFLSGYGHAQDDYEQIIRGTPRHPAPAPPPIDKKILTA